MLKLFALTYEATAKDTVFNVDYEDFQKLIYLQLLNFKKLIYLHMLDYMLDVGRRTSF